MKIKNYNTWSTDAEKTYLDNIGDWRREQKVSREEKIDILNNYLEAAMRRVKWGNMDAKEVILYAQSLLAKLEKEE